ncbi:MAG TPA: amino acid adenylation domain-containing protein [Bacilli bacterium]|nr:amino acid adenylation domain-containing protein [Bacilli bacterium]
MRTFAFAPHDVILQKTPYVFDVSVWELFTWMFVGAQVCFLPPGAEKEPDRIAAAIEQYGVTAVHFVPSMLSAFLDALEKGELLRKLSTVQWVFATGEPLTTKQVQRFHKVVHPFNGARIYNLYGPTEATVEVSAYQVPVEFAGDAVPIGKPIDNTKIYVLDAQQGLQPIGVPGELMISGVNVARGYWSRPELTAEKFVRDPFDETARMYKTGDLARWLPDGNLEYLGRMDHQVKIRGYRIELGEIEAQLLQVGAVKEAVVLNLEDAQGDNYLAAYLVTEEKRTAAPLREELAKVLPDYMIPSYFLFLDRMPVTTNGKVDRKALPEPTVDLVRTTEYVAPRTQTEADLAMLWAAVLNIEEVGVHDNFFELGGHSLKANDLITRLYREWQVELPLREVFQYPTVAELAVRLEAAERTEYEEIPPVQQADAYPISPAQKRLFVLDQLEGPSTRYNMSAAMLVEGELDKARFEATLRTLIDRHESLRTSFTFQNGEAVQVVHDEVPFVIDELEGTEDTAHRQIHEYFRPFQLDVAPLLRVGLLRTGPQRAYLLLDMHHIISDGTSMGIFIREFMQAYEGQELPLMSVQYKDFTVWHAASDAADKAEAQAPFWQEEFADAVPVLDLPLDAPRPLTMSYEGAKHHFEVSAELSEALQKFSQEQGVTLFMTLLAAFNVLLARYSGQQDLVVGSPVSGRFHPAQEQMIGMFVNTLALRNFPAFDKPFAQFVQEVKERQLRAFEHQEYPFDKLVETVQPARDQSRSPVIDTLFVLQNREQHEFACEGLTLAPYPLDMPLAKFDLSFYAAETESGFACDLEYRTKLFAAETIAGMADRLVRVLEEVVRDPQRPIGDLQWLASEEQAQAIAWATEQDERYVLNKRGRLQPAGVIGELYLTTPPQEQPKENGWPSEVAHPVEPDRTLYRAGVTARYTQAGSLDVIGRSDQEVMLNGYRLHLADVAKGLQAHDEVREAVVILREMAGREVLCAYVATYLAAAEVKAYAESIRPEPLVPSYFTVLAELPRTVAGDVDEALLPQPQAMEEATKESGPMNPTEARLMQIWSQVLGQAAIGAEEDFFFDLSGNSMQATALVAHVFQEFGVEMTLRDVFEAPTIEEMAERIMASDAMADRQIPVVAKAAQYQVSSAQKRLYILNQLEAQPTAYNMPDALIVEGELDHRRFARAFEALVARHESLRTSFAFVNGELTQQVHEQVAFAVDIRQVDEADVARRAEEFVRPFDLSQAPLLRVELLQLKPARHVLLFDMHHIISDGTSMEIVIRDFLALYEERDLPPLRIQYKDYAAWQTEWLEGEEMQKQALYWKEVFAEEPPALDLPNDFPRGARMDFQGDAVRFQLGRELSEHVRQTVSEQGITLFMFLLAGYTALLHRYTGQEDVVVGAPIAGRQHQDIVPLIGMFANTLALRAKPQADKSFRQYLQEVKNVALGAYEHQEYPFELLVDQLQLKHDLSRNPLFDTMLVLQNETSTLESQGLTFAPYHSETTASKFDLILHAVDKTEGIEFILEYRTSLFRAQKVEGIAQHLVQLIASAVAQPDAAIGDLTILNEQEKAELLRMGGAQQERPTETMHQVFERRAAETPERIALQYGDVEVSYGALNARANRLARLLQERGLQSGDLAAVLMERSPRMAESILAVWKAGAAYIPIEPSFPKERILTILQDAQTRVVITDTNCGTDEQGLPYWPQQVDLDAVAERLQEFSSDDLLQPVSVDDLAYVIYTSGSTGKPKGAMIEHVGMMNHLWAKVEDLGLTAQDRIVQNASHSFDISVWQYFAALAVGGTTVIYPNKVTLDPSRFLAVTAQERITILEVVPSYLGLLLRLAEDGATDPQRLVHLRHLLVTGEALQAELSRQWFELFPAITLVNAYGPTEASDDVTHHIMTAAPETELVPIGRAVRNFNLYMVDQRMNLQPFGAVGEICVSGFAVGRGYLGDTEKTRAAFGEDPFVEEPGRRLYKTGDLGKFLPDGSVQYLGRLDHQVKVRGFRIELGEIEHQLLRHPQVREAVVMDRQDANDMTFLCAFVGGEGELNEATLRASLALDLPDYMIPASFVLLEQMPLTPNGKVDRKALARLQVSAGSTQELVAPRTPYEKALVPLWAEVLGVADVGVTENFFELGGHSLKAMNLVSHVYKVLNAHLPLNVVFNHPTIEQLAAFLEQQASSPFADIPAVEQAEFYPVSSPQKRLFLLDQMEDIGTTYNIPFAVILEGPLDQKRFDRAFQKLAERHEALRTSFTFANGVPVQKVHDRVVVPVERMQAKLEELDDVMQAFVRPFDLTQAPLLRVGLVELEADLHALLFDIHHIVSDGVSSNVMMTDFLALYRGQLLEPLRIQYKDFSIWQNEWLGSDAALTHRDFWVNLFRDGVPVLELPTDRPRREESRFEGDLVRFSIDGELRRALERLGREKEVTLFMTLITAYQVLLFKYTGDTDFVIGTPVAGRSHPGLDRILGMFINTLPLRLQVDPEQTFASLLEDVRTTVLQAFEHQDYPLDLVVEALDAKVLPGRNPLMDTMFVLQNVEPSGLKFGELTMQEYEFTNRTSKFDLSLIAYEGEEAMHFLLEYATALFDRETVETIAEHYANLLARIVENPETTIVNLDVQAGTAAEEPEPDTVLADADDLDFDF